MNVSASVYSQQRVSIDVTKTKLSKVLKLIENQSDYYFVYSSSNVPVNKDVTLTVKNKLVPDVLSTIFNHTNLSYSISEEGLIVINKKQDRQVSGLVKNENGDPLIGATVRVKGTGSGLATDINGRFSMSIPESSVLIISFAGFQTQEVNIGQQNNIEITLIEDSAVLADVVVTALGEKRERRTLGYSVSQVQGEDLTQARENNVANSLVGKVAGLDITSTSGGAGAATNVMIRGVSSLSQSNQPLYVINGIPMENQPASPNVGSQWDNAPDLGDAIGNLNPDDIESISVLKGAAAAALYGSRAKAGVILITTKSGRGNNIEFSSNYVIEQVMDRTNWQYVYGQGSNGIKPASAADASQVGGSSWGAKLDGSSVVQFDGVSRPYSAQRNNIKNFYRDGSTWTNTLALNKTFEGGAIRFSASDLDNNSIVPNSGLDRQTFNLTGTFEPVKRLLIDARANYILEKAKNRPMLSDGAGNPNYNAIFLPTSINVNDLKPGKDEFGNEVPYNKGNAWDTNPWFAAYEIANNTHRERLISSFNSRYTFDDGLFIQARAGRDSYTDKYLNVLPTGTAYRPKGQMSLQQLQFTDLNVDVLMGKSFNINDAFTLTPNVGASYRNTKTNQIINNGSDFLVPGVYNIIGSRNKSVSYAESEQETQGLYGTLEFAYRDILYLTGSARSDWFSTLATPGKDNKLNVVYPSISGSFVFSELLQPGLLTFGKLRAGYATVGQATGPYQTALTYGFFSESLNGNPLGLISDSFIPNPSLKASLASEFEVGVDLRFLNNRLSTDLTYYHKRSDDEISSINTSNTIGYDGAILNAGRIENKGFEALITGLIVKNDNFSWTSSINATYNKNTVLSLAEGVDEDLVATSRAGVGFLKNIPGKAAAQVMAYDFKYDTDGKTILLDDLGAPQQGELIAYGSAFNKWFAGWNNEFNYKGVVLSALVDGKWGGKLFSATDYYGYIKGLHQGTLENRDALGNIAAQYYTNTANNTSHRFVQDASFIKLRQITLGYHIPASVFNNKINGLNISLVGRNLAILSKKTDNIDPESSYSANFPGLELGGVPPARTFGINLNVKF